MALSAIGIDLGTTYSCVGVWRNGGVEIVPNDQSNRTTPSCVAFTDGERLIGEGANNQIASNASNTVFDMKRLMGRSFSDASVKSGAKYWPFGVIAGDHDKPLITVTYHGEKKELSPEEISAMVLVRMKETAEEYVGPGTSIKQVVVSVPAYFNGSQRQATMDACQIAGLDMCIINEPSAAAIAYSLNRTWSDEKESTVLVYDLGGGTLDVSLVVIKSGALQVRATAGDTCLGGEDFTNNMVDHFVNEFKKQNPDISGDISGNKKALGRLRRSCEQAKRKLSTNPHITVDLEALFEGVDFYSTISRHQLEELNEDLFRRCMEPVERCLMDAKMDKNKVDKVVLVGGSTRIPRVHKLVQEFFKGKELCRSINADEAVAYGATVQAAILADIYTRPVEKCSADKSKVPGYWKLRRSKKKEAGKSIKADDEASMPRGGIQTFPQLTDITPFSQGIGMLDGLISVAFPRNTAIPTCREMELTTREYNKSSMDITMYEGEMAMPMKFHISGIASATKGVPTIKVLFHMEQDGILRVSAQDKESGQEGKITFTSYVGRLSMVEIQRMAQDAHKYKARDEEHKKNVQARNDIQTLLFTVSNNVKKLKGTRLLHHPEPTREQEKETPVLHDSVSRLPVHAPLETKKAQDRKNVKSIEARNETTKKLQYSIKKLQETVDETTNWIENKEITTREIIDKQRQIEDEYDSLSSQIGGPSHSMFNKFYPRK